MSDDLLQQLLQDTTTLEALRWLRGGGADDFRSIGELETNEESIELVERLYAAGAVEVLAVEIDTFAEGQNTDSLILQLPTDATRRARLLEWAGALALQQGYEPEPDTGQQYILISLEEGQVTE